jgi:hypothetical protein
MPAPIHSLMQDANDRNRFSVVAVDDHMVSGRQQPARRREIRQPLADLRVARNAPQHLVEDRAIGEDLGLALGLEGVLQDIGKVLLCSRREQQAPFRA